MFTTIFPGVKGDDIILDAPGTEELLSKEEENANSGRARRKAPEPAKRTKLARKPSNAEKSYTSIPKVGGDPGGDIYEI